MMVGLATFRLLNVPAMIGGVKVTYARILKSCDRIGKGDILLAGIQFYLPFLGSP